MRLHRHAFCKGVAFVVAVLVQVCFTSLHTHVCGESQESVVRLPVAVMGFFDCIQVQQHRNPGHACDWGDCVFGGMHLGALLTFARALYWLSRRCYRFFSHTLNAVKRGMHGRRCPRMCGIVVAETRFHVDFRHTCVLQRQGICGHVSGNRSKDTKILYFVQVISLAWVLHKRWKFCHSCVVWV